jgi:DNA-binding NarL/FixJ family response regulator
VPARAGRIVVAIMTDQDVGRAAGVRVPPPRRGSDPPLARVTLVSDQGLVAEAVAAALESRHLAVRRIAGAARNVGHPLERELADTRPDVALLIYEIVDAVRLAEAVALLHLWSGPWVVLTGTDNAWEHGALLEAGASVVCANAVGLDEVESLLERLARGEQVLPEEDRAFLLRQWASVKAQSSGLRSRLEALTPREREVLKLMRRGSSVRVMARQLGVSESTARSHVRAVLRKLDVRTQLAAVAAVQALDDRRSVISQD